MTVTLDSSLTETINTLFPVVNFLKCVVTEVLFSIVAFKTLSSYKVVFGGIFRDSIIINFLLVLTVTILKID